MQVKTRSVQPTIEFRDDSPQQREHVNTEVDLLLFDRWGRQSRHPIRFATTTIGSPSSDYLPDIEVVDPKDPKIRVELQWKDSRLFLLNKSGYLQTLVNGLGTSHRELYDRDHVQIAHVSFRVAGLRAPLAVLEGYTAPHEHQRWVLSEGPNLVGRAGSRPNQIELNDPTVSRGHAQLQVVEHGVSLECETSSSQTKVNSRALARGEILTLRDGDLLQFGRQILRIRMSEEVRSVGVPLELAVLSLKVVCPVSTTTPQRRSLYREAYDCLLEQVPSTVVTDRRASVASLTSISGIRGRQGSWHWLPFLGETLYAVALPRVNLEGPVDRLARLAKQCQASWNERKLDSRGISLVMGLHIGTADIQPPLENYASSSRTIATAEALANMVAPGQSKFVISRAAWQSSKLINSTQRIGLTKVWGHWTPVEAYYAHTLENQNSEHPELLQKTSKD